MVRARGAWLEPTRSEALTLVSFVALVVIAGSNVVGVRISNRELAPFWGAGLRFLLGDVLLFAVVLLRRMPLPQGRALMGAVLYGILGFGGCYALCYWALVEIQAGLASVVLATAPLLTLMLAFAHRIEAFRWQCLAGAFLALLGTSGMFAHALSASVPVTPMLAMLAGTACVAEASVLLKAFPGTHPVTTNAVGLGVGALALLVLSRGFAEPWTLPTHATVQAAFVYLVVFGSVVTFVLFVYVLNRWTATSASYQVVLMPFVTISLSGWLDGEALSLGVLGGGASVLLGVYLGVLRRSRPEGGTPPDA